MAVEVRSRSSAGRLRNVIVAVMLALAMFAFGFSVYLAAGYLKMGRTFVERPDRTTAIALPGTMYVVQSGTIYRFQRGSFTAVTHSGGWMQPAATPDGSRLVAVRGFTNWSDLYAVAADGKSTTRLTNNSSSVVEGNHWIFYPSFSADGSRIFYDFDPKDPYNSYRVDLAILESPTGNLGQWRQWTYPNHYTGGDVDPVPLRDGSLVYTKFSIDAQSVLHSQIWLQSRAGSPGIALTDPNLNCISPTVAPDGKLIAMVCRKDKAQTADLYVAPFDPTAPGAGTPIALVTGQLVASPAFSPDGKTIAFLAPAAAQGPFQLWTVQSAGTPSPKQITTDLGLDAQSAPVWLAR